jgi:adenine phosphoribosyltransferase
MTDLEFLLSKIRDVQDFPQPGILFKDITPLLQDREALRVACRLLAEPFRERGVSVVVGIESRGFIFGPPVALDLGVGFVPARKAGKLPWKTVEETYDLEYGTDQVQMHEDAIGSEDRVLIIDDLMATGGTAAAVTNLVRRMGGELVGLSILVELTFLEGRKLIDGVEIHSLLEV